MQNNTNSSYSVNRIKTQIMDLSQVLYGINQLELKTNLAEQHQETSNHTNSQHADHLDIHGDTVAHSDGKT